MEGLQFAAWLTRLAVLAGLVLSAATQPNCSDTTKDLHFTDEFPPQPMAKEAETTFHLTCNTSDPVCSNSSWYKWNNKTSAWDRVERTRYRQPSRDGQQLTIVDSDSFSDSGLYLCSATGRQQTINRTFDLCIVDCVSNPTQPVTFSAERLLQVLLGGTYSLRCGGDYGCREGGANTSHADWSYTETGRPEAEVIGSKGTSDRLPDRYSISQSVSSCGKTLTTTLTISGVTEEDLSRVFVCSLRKRDLPTVGFNTTLSRIETEEIVERHVALIFGLLSLAIVAGLAMLATNRLCWPWVCYTLRSKTNKLPGRGSDHEFDVMLISCEEEEIGEGGLNQRLRSQLLKQGYSVYSPSSEHYWVQQIDDIVKCVTVIFIIATGWAGREEAEDEEHILGFSRYFDVCKGEVGSNVVMVTTRRMSDEDWKNEVSSNYKSVFKEIPRLCAVAVWPDDSATWLKKKNFWSTLKSYLPVPVRDKGRERTSSNESGDRGMERTPSNDSNERLNVI